MSELAIDLEIEGIYAADGEVPHTPGAIDGANSMSILHST